ncbi:MAG TPA: type IV toxin-antitoxin system AbiEi family antitoxin domain-containing protein, partial [Longimicrobiales bacterium]|nr:type IV toxin-antitoxin system AbiEi family antitoxin domain-containing protein [Longimicrobiales bacterium]
PAAAPASAPTTARARDAVIRDLAGDQHGVIRRSDVVAAGVPPHAVDNRVRDGRLVALHRGVYRVPGPVRGRYEREMAAVLACGEDAHLSHRSAAGLYGLRPEPARGSKVEVSVVDRFVRPGQTVRVHRVARLDPEDRTVAHGISVTAPARTILDLAATAAPREVERAMAVAARNGLADRDQVADVVARHPGSPGAATLRALLAAIEAPAFVRSEAEERLLALIRRAGLPAPKTNAVIRGIEVDFLWGAARLVVEVDGEAYHAAPDAFERDRRRDALLAAAGYRVVRVTWRQLVEEADAVLVRLAQALVATER